MVLAAFCEPELTADAAHLEVVHIRWDVPVDVCGRNAFGAVSERKRQCHPAILGESAARVEHPADVIGHEIEATTGEELVRFIRALGQHRYVTSRLHLVHAIAVEAAGISGDPALGEARAWAESVLENDEIDKASKDERLYRRVSESELVAILSAFWVPSPTRPTATITLLMRLAEIGVAPPDPEAEPFDESAEEDMFPVLVDAGWELSTLRALDPERHRGAIAAFGDAMSFDVAKFEEENAIPELVTLHELPALGPLELLSAVDDQGTLNAPFVLWTSGNETYVDYVLRGVLKVAKLPTE